MIFGVFYWTVWRIILPKVFRYKLVPNKTVLDDGTVVNVVRLSQTVFSICKHRLLFSSVFTEESGVKVADWCNPIALLVRICLRPSPYTIYSRALKRLARAPLFSLLLF